MKNILIILFILISYTCLSQVTYNPLNGVPINKSLSPAQANPIDSRSYFFDAVNFLWRPYQNTAEVLSYLNLSKYRVGQFDIIVNVGGTLNPNGTFSGGVNYCYWFKDGTADGNLVLKYPFIGTNSQIMLADGSLGNIGAGLSLTSHTLSSTTFNLNTIDVYLVGGQSNGNNSGDTTLSPKVISGTVFQYRGGSIVTGNDPIGSNAANFGSAWPAFGITYYTITNRKICFVPAAVNATSQTVAANTGAGTWDTTGTLFGSANALVTSAMAQLSLLGYTPIFKGILWDQGENDATAINSSIITQATYIAAFRKMIARFRGIYGPRMPFYIFRTGWITNQSQAGFTSIANAQDSVANADSLTNIVFFNAMDFNARGLMKPDFTHYLQAGYNEMGRMGAENVLNSNAYKWQNQAGSIYLPYGNVGIGNSLPTNKLDIIGNQHNLGNLNVIGNIIDTGQFSNVNGPFNLTNSQVNINNSLSNPIILVNTQSGFVFNKWTNTVTGSNNGIGDAYFADNSSSSFLQLAKASTSNLIFPDGSIVRNSGTGGLWLISDNSPIKFVNGVGFTEYARFMQSGSLLLGTQTELSSSILTLQSTSRGFRPPVMAASQRLAISSPATGLLVVDSDTLSLFMYTGSTWLNLHGSGSGGGGSGNPNSNIGSGYRWAVPNTNNIKTVFGTNGVIIDSATNSNALTLQVDSSIYATKSYVNNLPIDTIRIVPVGASGIPGIYGNGKDTIFAKRWVFNNGLTSIQQNDSSILVQLNGNLNQNTSINGVGVYQMVFANFLPGTNKGFRVDLTNNGSDAGWDMFTKDSATGFWARIPKGTPGQSLQMLSSGGIGWAAQAGGGGSSSLSNTFVGFGNVSNALTGEGRFIYDSVHLPGFVSTFYVRRLTIASSRATTSIGTNDYYTAKFIGPYMYLGDTTLGEPTGIEFGDPYGASQGTPMRINFGWGGTEEGNWWINAHYPNGTHTKFDPAKYAQWIAFSPHSFVIQAWGTDGSAWNGSGSKTVFRIDNIEGAGAVTGSQVTMNRLKVTDPSTSSYDNTDGTYMQLSVNSTIGQFTGNVSAYQFLKPLSSSDATPGATYTSYLGQTSFTIPSSSTITDPFVINSQSATKPMLAIFGGTDGASYSMRLSHDGFLGIGIASTATARLEIAGTSSSVAALRLDGQAAPSSPNDGDIWNNSTSHHLFVRLNGTTFQIDQQSGTTPNWETVLNQGGSLSTNNTYRVAGSKITLVGSNGLAWAISGATPRMDWIDTVNTLAGTIQMIGGEFNISTTSNIIRTNNSIFTVNASSTSVNYDLNTVSIRNIMETNPHSLTEPNIFWNKVSTGSPDQLTVYQQNGNYAMAIRNGGDAIFGASKTDNSTGQVQINNTTNQLALHYDNSNYTQLTTNSGGLLTITPSGTNGIVEKSGTTAQYAAIGGAIFDVAADAGNTTTTETDLYSITLPANIITTDKQKIDFKWDGIYVGSTSLKQLKVYFAGTQLFASGTLGVTSNADWEVTGWIIRTSSSTARCYVVLKTGGVAAAVFDGYIALTGLDFTTTNILKITGQASSTGAATNDIVLKMGTGNWVPAAPAGS